MNVFCIDNRLLLCCHISILVFSLCCVCQTESRDCGSCTPPVEFQPDQHNAKYTIGVLGIKGEATAYAQYESTFSHYLSATAGKRFDPPIEFEMTFVQFQEMYDWSRDQLIDFNFVNPSASACLNIEYGSQMLASVTTRAVVNNQTSYLSEFGGLIITRADNDEINAIEDLKDKVVGAVNIAGFGAALLQFQEMQKAGMSYINDPAQIVFTSNQKLIVTGVLNGDFEAGFVRTGMIEKTTDAQGNPVDASALKILQPRQDLTDGQAFPYVHSTPLYPEWSLAALRHVSSDVTREVQHALLALAEHARTGSAIQQCLDDNGPEDHAACYDLDVVNPEARCDTTSEVAQVAARAMADGGYVGFRTALAYNNVRQVLYDTGFVSKVEETSEWRCSRPAELYESVVCPEGFFKKTREEFNGGCSQAGLECAEGFECTCKPCFQASRVEVAPADVYEPGTGCSKMSICGTSQQTKPMTMYIVDHEASDTPTTPVVRVHDGMEETLVDVVPGPSANVHEFTVSSNRVGSVIIEIFIDGEQIPSSPLRLQIESRECSLEYIDDLHVADAEGNCVCQVNSFTFGNTCVLKSVFYSILMAPVAVVIGVLVLMYVRKKKQEADSVWLVKEDELVYQTPRQIVGESAFGVVVLAEYRGSKVAVKRAKIPTAQSTKPDSSTSLGGNAKGGSSSNTSVNSDIEQALQQRGRASTREITNSEQQDSSRIHLRAAPMSLGRSRKREFIREMRILSNLRHPNITTVMGAVLRRNKDPMLVMEYMDHGSLYEVLRNPTLILEPEIIHGVMQDITRGLLFLHSSKPQLVHGDLKSSHVLLDSKFRAKLSNVRLANQNQSGATGTPLWMAPELLRGESSNTTKSDIYSVGIIFNEMYSRQDPYEGEKCCDDLLDWISDRTINERPNIPQDCPIKIQTLIKFLWHADPKLRPTAEGLKNRLNDLDSADVAPLSSKSSTKKSSIITNQGGYEEFLYQAFPRHVADTLKKGDKVEPESHEMVTIFFSDIVGFTNIASSSEPIKVSNMLDRLYLKFDALATKHGLFKIETIGDAYMCAGNLATDQTHDHVKRVAYFARDAIQASSETLIDEDDPSRGPVQIRVGFHSGPVVSSVIGSLNPRYGLFGDTVNVAARMESTSEESKIHCSRASAEILMRQAPEISVRPRGKIAVKGKGSMFTFWIC